MCRMNGISQRGMEIAQEIMESGPARRVDSRSLSPNITTRFTSQKMGMTIQAESRSIELANIYMKETDRSVLGYWDQPFHRADFSYFVGKRRVRTQSTLDFFVISDEFIGYEECKPYEQLVKLAKKTPNRYRFNKKLGIFEIPPLAHYLDGTGLQYRIISDRDINKIYVENQAFLYDYRFEAVDDDYYRLIKIVHSLLEVVGNITISELEKKVSDINRAMLFKAIVKGDLYADLDNQPLQEPERIYLARSKGKLPKIVCDENQEEILRRTLPSGSPKEIAISLQRYKIIKPLLEKEKTIKEVAEISNRSTRTIFRWLKLYRVDQDLNNLIPKNKDKGNRDNKIPETINELMQDYIDSYYLNKTNKTPNHVYQLLFKRCKDDGLSPPSKKTFYERINDVSDVRSLKLREGAKSAYQATAYRGLTDNETEDAPFSSVTRFLERCHIDHTLLDIELISSDGINLGRPWITAIIDEYSGYLLAFYLSFGNPSSISIMCVIRVMVSRHQLFPEMIVVDGGKEFESIYFEQLMAKYRCGIISRKGKPRSGGPIERFFGILNTIFLKNISGNTSLTKDIRKLSATHNPKKLAVWEPEEFFNGLQDVIDGFNSTYVRHKGKTPEELRNDSILRFGQRNLRKVEYDDKFNMFVLPSPKRRTSRLRRGETIQVNRVSYWHPCFRTVPRDGVSVAVRYDPFNLNHVFIYYKNEWLRCRSVRKQHRKADLFESALIAEISKKILIINSEKKKESRSDMAELVEILDVENTHKKGFEKQKKSENVVGDRFNNKDLTNDIWDIDIPNSSREKN